MPLFVDIAYASAPRQLYTYRVPEELCELVSIGKRVWSPFRNYNAIGMVVRVHREEPSFEYKSIRKVLDNEAILDESLLKLTEWMHRFYYCSWGEAIQAVLLVGLTWYQSNCSSDLIDTETILSAETNRPRIKIRVLPIWS